MRRILLTAVVVIAAAVGSASPAVADNTGNQPPGPPFVSGSDNGASVVHCNIVGEPGEVPGAVVFNKNGIHGNCDFV
jgi:hypothetical protein